MALRIKSTLLIIILALGYSYVYSQSISDIQIVLNTAFEDNSVQFKHKKTNQLSTLDYNVPLIEKVELRSETNDFNLRKQDLSLRVSPNTGSSRRAHRQYHESVMFMAEMEYNTEIMKMLFTKYQLVKDYVFSKEMLRLEKVKNTVALDKVKLLKKMVSLSSFDIVELIEAEDEVNKLQRKIQNIENSVTNLNRQLSAIISKEKINIGISDIISVAQIKSLISLNKLNNTKKHPEEEVLSAKHYNALMEFEWEASKNSFSIGYLQAKYGHDPDKSFGNNFSLGIGFDFPIKGSTRLDLNEIKVDILDTQSEYLELVDRIENNRQMNESRLKSLISMYDLLSIQIEKGNANHALIEYSRQGIASPLAILKLKELTVNNEALLIEIRSDIIETYLNYIYDTGAIGDIPYKNYFNENLSYLQ